MARVRRQVSHATSATSPSVGGGSAWKATILSALSSTKTRMGEGDGFEGEHVLGFPSQMLEHRSHEGAHDFAEEA